MADLTPPPAALGVAASVSMTPQGDESGLVLQGQAAVVEVPEKLQNLTRSVVLGAQVEAQNPDGTVALKTAAGAMTVKPSVQLPPNIQQIMVQIQPGTPPTAGTIYTNAVTNPAMTQNSTLMNALAGNIAASTATNLQPNTTQIASSANIFPTLNVGTVFAATVVQASPKTFEQNSEHNLQQNPQSFQQSQSGNSNLQNPETFDSNLPIMPQAKNLPANPQAIPNFGAGFSNAAGLSPRLLETMQQTMNFLDQQGAGAATGSNSAQSSLPLTVGLERLPVGSQVAVQIVQIGQNSAQTQIPNAGSQSGQIAGQIVSVMTQGNNANAQIIVQTDVAQIALPSNIAAGKPVIGTNLILQLVQQNTDATLASSKTLSALDTTKEKGWPALDAVVQNIAAQNASATPHLLNTIPKLNGDLPVAALFFMTALRSGKIENWLGPQALDDKDNAIGEDDLKTAKDILGKDFAALKDTKATSTQGDWKLYQMPLLTDQGLDRLQLAVRDHYEKAEDEADIDGQGTRVTRFVVDVDYSAYGQVQLDGFMREKKLDLVVRTQNAFPDEIRHALLGVYNEALGNQGMNGTLSFQAGYANWIKLMQNNQHSNYSA